MVPSSQAPVDVSGESGRQCHSGHEIHLVASECTNSARLLESNAFAGLHHDIMYQQPNLITKISGSTRSEAVHHREAGAHAKTRRQLQMRQQKE